MLPLRTAQPIAIDLDLKALFNPIPTTISTPVSVHLLRHELRNHPNQSLVAYLLDGFTNGFNIGYTGERFPVCTKNLLSTLNNPGPVSEAISKELSRGHIAGPFTSPPFPNLHCSPLGCVPKKDGSYRLIIDLSSPPGRSVNEKIPKDSFSVVFAKFDDAVELLRSLGPGALMGKIDIKHAFRIFPVRLADIELLGTFWQGFYFVELCLPFVLRSSVFIFNSFADASAWILRNNYLIHILTHYLDDFGLLAQLTLHNVLLT